MGSETDKSAEKLGTNVKKAPKKRVNVRTPEVMSLVEAEVEDHYRSQIVDRIKQNGGTLTVGNTTVRLAQQFGFCYGVERAIDLAYASRRVFQDNEIYLIGEIIHNPEVNRQLSEMGIKNLAGPNPDAKIDDLTENDVVIVPAFGAETAMMERIKARGCQIVDTTCGDVMSVWKRVRGYAKNDMTSIIHGKADHEETRATASRALGKSGTGHYLVILTLDDTDYVCDYMMNGGDREAFMKRFAGAFSDGFNPDKHLIRVGVANQTTMLKSETQELQRRIQETVGKRDGNGDNFVFFDTICGATQERQDALFDMLETPPNMLLVVGGYNSSNTAHLVEIGEKENLPTFFIRNAECLQSLSEIVHFDLHSKSETTSYSEVLLGNQDVVIGITAGASCPNNLIADTIEKVFELRGISKETLQAG